MMKISRKDFSKLTSVFVTNSIPSNNIFDINKTFCAGTGAADDLAMQGLSTAMVLLSFARIIQASAPSELKYVYKYIGHIVRVLFLLWI